MVYNIYIMVYIGTFGVSLTQVSLPCRFHICIIFPPEICWISAHHGGMHSRAQFFGHIDSIKTSRFGKIGVVQLCIHVQQLCKGKERTPILQRIIRMRFEFQFSLPPNSKPIFSATPLILVGFGGSSTEQIDTVQDLASWPPLDLDSPLYGFLGNACADPQDSARGTAMLVPLQWGMEFWLFGHVRRLGQARHSASFLFCDNKAI